MSSDHVTDELLRRKMVNLLADYKAKMQKWERQLLEWDIEQKSVKDFFGRPRDPKEYEQEILEDVMAEEHQPIRIPEGFKIFSSLVGELTEFGSFGVEGYMPYWYPLSFSVNTRVQPVAQILEDLTLRPEYKYFEVVCGWLIASDEHQNCLYAVYYKEDHWSRKNQCWRYGKGFYWKYAKANTESGFGCVFKSVEELIEGWPVTQRFGVDGAPWSYRSIPPSRFDSTVTGPK